MGEWTKEDELKFKSWYGKASKLLGLNSDSNPLKHQYDYRGYYSEFVKGKETQSLKNFLKLKLGNPKAHGFDDKYKLPGHPTFSALSKFSNENTRGGTWEDDSTFVPSNFNVEQYGRDFYKNKRYRD